MAAIELSQFPSVAGDRPARAPFGAVRLLGIAGLTVLVADVIAYLVRRVPVEAVRLPHSEVSRHSSMAIVALGIVVAVDTLFIVAIRHRRRRAENTPAELAPGRAGEVKVRTILRIQRFPSRAVAVSAGTSTALVGGALLLGLPLWAIVLGAVVPWFPLLAIEGLWRHEHYGFYAVFMAISLLQVGHLGEHTVQVLQLGLTHGDLARSHGVFGQLDFETIHFVWDSAVWLGSGILLSHYSRNRWLWISFLAASIHEIEHLYLLWINVAHFGFYVRGGYAGILGRGGVIGSPLYRPYLHFSYNYVVVMSMLVAFWDQTRCLFDQYVARSWPVLDRRQLVAATRQARPVRLRPNDVMALPSEGGDRPPPPSVYLVTKGAVEVTSAQGLNQMTQSYGAGQSFSLPGGGPPVVRATRAAELLVLPRSVGRQSTRPDSESLLSVG